MRYFTSDLHLGHENIIKYCNRPFTTTSAMNQDIIEKISKLSATDEIYLLGDIALGKVYDNLALLKDLPVKKIFIGGNHDYIHPYNKPSPKKIEKFRESTNAHEIIQKESTITLSNGINVTLNHLPYPNSHPSSYQYDIANHSSGPTPTDKFASYRPTGDNWLLCGHVHEKWILAGKSINVGLDAWGGQLVSEREIIQIISNPPDFLPIIPWV